MEQKSTKYYSTKQENLIADYLGWKVVTGSGARAFHPGDVVSDQWLGECKTHTEPFSNLRFDFDVWTKISREAASQFKKPVLFVDDGSQTIERTWCLFDVSSYSLREIPIIDYTNCSSMTFKYFELEEKSKSGPVFVRNLNMIMCILSLKNFKRMIQNG